MSKKYKSFFIAIAVLFVSMIVGSLFVFFGNDDVKVIPESLSVEKIGDDFYLVAQYNANYHYRFSIEKKIDDKYYLVEKVKNDTNSLNLSQQHITITAGDQYRFSVCYTTKNSLDGKMSERIEWCPTLTLNAIDSDSVTKTNERLTWDAVYMAECYEVVVISDFGEMQTDTTENPEYSLNNLAAGHYNFYIRAMSPNNEFLTPSRAISVDVVKKGINVIVDAAYQDGVLEMTMTQNATRFELYVDEDCVATFTVEPNEEVLSVYTVTIENCQFVFDGIDFLTSQVKIKSADSEYILESELIEVYHEN